MPKKVSAWACSFGCGRRVLTSRKTMEKHEKTCARNPERKACKICTHYTTGTIPVIHEGKLMNESVPKCSIGAMPYGAMMHFNCQKWEAA